MVTKNMIRIWCFLWWANSRIEKSREAQRKWRAANREKCRETNRNCERKRRIRVKAMNDTTFFQALHAAHVLKDLAVKQ